MLPALFHAPIGTAGQSAAALASAELPQSSVVWIRLSLSNMCVQHPNLGTEQYTPLIPPAGDKMTEQLVAEIVTGAPEPEPAPEPTEPEPAPDVEPTPEPTPDPAAE